MGDDIMKIFCTRKEYKMLQDENTAIRENRNKYRCELNEAYVKEAAYIKKINELLVENKKLSGKCAAYSKYFFEGTNPSEEIQEKVARDLEVVRLKDELFKEKVLNKLSSIETYGLCNSALQNYYYNRTYF